MPYSPEQVALVKSLHEQGKSDWYIETVLWRQFPELLQDESLGAFIKEQVGTKGPADTKWPAQRNAVPVGYAPPGTQAEPKVGKKASSSQFDGIAEGAVESNLKDVIMDWIGQPAEGFDHELTVRDGEDGSDGAVWVGVVVDLFQKGTKNKLYTLQFDVTGWANSEPSYEPEGVETVYDLQDQEVNLREIMKYHPDGTYEIEKISSLQEEAKKGLSLNDALKLFSGNPTLLNKAPIDIDVTSRMVHWNDGSKTSFDETVQLALEHMPKKESDFGFMDGPVDLGKDPKGDFPSVSWMPRGQEDKDASLGKEATVTHQKDGWHVLSEEGKNLGGPYGSKEEAVKRLRQVEYFKHHSSLEGRIVKQGSQRFVTPVDVDVTLDKAKLFGHDEIVSIQQINLTWTLEYELRDWGVKGMYVAVPDQTIEFSYEYFDPTTDGYVPETKKMTVSDVQVEGLDHSTYDSHFLPRTLELYNGKWTADFGNYRSTASKKLVLKKIAEEVLSQEEQKQIAAQNGPEYNSALAYLYEALKNRHPFGRSLEHAVQQMDLMKIKVDPKILSQLAGTYLTGK